MQDFLSALGLVLVIEGLLYALAPQVLRRMARALEGSADSGLRLGGLAAVALGVFVVWLVRG